VGRAEQRLDGLLIVRIDAITRHLEQGLHVEIIVRPAVVSPRIDELPVADDARSCGIGHHPALVHGVDCRDHAPAVRLVEIPRERAIDAILSDGFDLEAVPEIEPDLRAHDRARPPGADRTGRARHPPALVLIADPGDIPTLIGHADDAALLEYRA